MQHQVCPKIDPQQEYEHTGGGSDSEYEFEPDHDYILMERIDDKLLGHVFGGLCSK